MNMKKLERGAGDASNVARLNRLIISCKSCPRLVSHCQKFLTATLGLCQPRVIVSLGKLAWDQTCRLPGISQYLSTPRPKFSHAGEVRLETGLWLVGSYHPSQQNTFTGRLTEPMLDNVFARVAELAELLNSSRPAKNKK